MNIKPPAASPPLPSADGGHLARLAQRAHGADLVLQRRRPALFEPARAWAGADGITDAEPAVAAARTTYRGSNVVDMQDAERDIVAAARTTHPASNRRSAGPHVSDACVDAASAQARPAQPPEAVRRQIATPHPGQPPSARPLPTVSSDARVRVALPQRAVAPTSARAAPVLFAAAGPADPASETPVYGDAVPAAQPLITHAGELAQHDGAAPLLRVPGAAATSALRRRAALRAATAAPVAAQPEPSPQRVPEPVQVMIGRVEVRAVTAPAPAVPRHRAAAPRLGLEQYLRERQRGER